MTISQETICPNCESTHELHFTMNEFDSTKTLYASTDCPCGVDIDGTLTVDTSLYLDVDFKPNQLKG